MFFKTNKEKNDEASKPFVEHLEDLRWVILKSFVAILVIAIVVFFKIEWIFDTIILGPAHKEFITYRVLCSIGRFFEMGDVLCMSDIQIQLQSNRMSSQFMMSFTMSLMIGFILAFPYIVWLFWTFIKPALRVQEIKKVKYIVFWISLLFFLGVSFGYFIIAPYTVNFFASYTLSPLIQNNFLLSDYIDTILQLVLGSGIVFQLPLFIYMLSKIGIVTADFLRKHRKYAVIIVLVIAAIITPPDVLSQLLVTFPLWILYEIGILIASKTEKKEKYVK